MCPRDRFLAGVSAVLLFGLTSCAPDPSKQRDKTTLSVPAAEHPIDAADGLSGQVAAARVEHNLIALGAVIASKDGILDIAVDGTRAGDNADPVQIADKWHLGSNTKALTALLYGQLVERGDAEWGATLPALFPDLADKMDPAWQAVTIEDLFAHRTGMMQMGGFWLIARRNDERPVTEQRQEIAHDTLIAPPSKTPGEFEYNNLNYIIAGAAIEGILAEQDDLPKTWEDAMQALLFDRLSDPEAQSAFGFGPPPEGLVGHRSILGAFPTSVGRGKSADNPAILGPAGTLHGTLAGHAMLAIEFLREDSALIPAHMRAHLFTSHPDDESGYAMGWGVYDHKTYGRIYQHSGSNTAWYSVIVIAPDLDRVVIVNSNVFNTRAQNAANALMRTALDARLDQAPGE